MTMYTSRATALKRGAELQAQVRSLSNEISSLNAERSRLADQVSALTKVPSGPVAPLVLNNANVQRVLREQGLDDPVNQIVTDLKGRPNLIPFEAELGGTMAFRDNDKWVLTEKWVLAYFEDGHIGGRALLEYSVANGKLEWRRVAAYLIR